MAKRGAAWFGAALLFAAIAGCMTPPLTWPLPTGLGGVFGDMVLKLPALLIGAYPTGFFAMRGRRLLAGAARAGAVRLRLRPDHAQQHGLGRRPREAHGVADDDAFDDEDDDEGVLALGAIVHWWLSLKSFLRRSIAALPRQPAGAASSR